MEEINETERMNKKLKMLVIAEGKLKEGMEKMELEEVKVFETVKMKAEEMKIVVYIFKDGHIEIYEDALLFLFDESLAGVNPYYTVLIKGELAKPLDLPGNSLVRLELEDGAAYGDPLDKKVVQELATGCTSDVVAVFEREVKPFPDHQFMIMEYNVKREVKVEVEVSVSPPPVNSKQPEQPPAGRPKTSATSGRRSNSSGRGSAKSSKTSLKSLSKLRQDQLDGKDKVSPRVILKKKIMSELKPNSVLASPSISNGNNLGGVVDDAVVPDKLVVDVNAHRKKSEEEKPSMLKTADDGVVTLPPATGNVALQKPRKKVEKVKRQKPSAVECCDLPNPSPRDDPPPVAAVARFSPRLKSLDENSNPVQKPPPKKGKKAKASIKTLMPQAKASSSSKAPEVVKASIKTLMPQAKASSSSKAPEVVKASIKTLMPQAKASSSSKAPEVVKADPKPLPRPIPSPIPVVLEPAEPESTLPKPVPVPPSLVHAQGDYAQRIIKDVPRHQSLRIALQTFRNQDVQTNEGGK